MKVNFLDAFLGFLVLLITGLFLFYVYVTVDSKLFKSDSFRLHARFDNVDGIMTGSKVKMSGVNIGTVKSVSLEPDNFYASITMDFDKEYSFPDDTEASVQLGRSIRRELYIDPTWRIRCLVIKQSRDHLYSRLDKHFKFDA